LPTRTEIDARVEPVRSLYEMTDDELLAVIQQNPSVSLTAACEATTQVGAEASREAVGAVYRSEDELD